MMDRLFFIMVRSFLIILGFLAVFTSCATLQTKKKAVQSSVTTSAEMLAIAQQFSKTINAHFSKNTDQLQKNNILIALFPTKNNTISDLPLDYLNFSLVSELLKYNIRTVRVEDRSKALDELEFQLSGLGETTISPGNMKSPNYFIQIVVDENRYLLSSKTRRTERTFNLEVRNVETQLVVVSDSTHHIKDGAILRKSYSF
ncbi:hypothetical protein COTS27_00850 [Spirochaetota bacterium]|nr:hypothetical protein COTS27_00850 [Spirochaetota bacterium]